MQAITIELNSAIFNKCIKLIHELYGLVSATNHETWGIILEGLGHKNCFLNHLCCLKYEVHAWKSITVFGHYFPILHALEFVRLTYIFTSYISQKHALKNAHYYACIWTNIFKTCYYLSLIFKILPVKFSPQILAMICNT